MHLYFFHLCLMSNKIYLHVCLNCPLSAPNVYSNRIVTCASLQRLWSGTNRKDACGHEVRWVCSILSCESDSSEAHSKGECLQACMNTEDRKERSSESKHGEKNTRGLNWIVYTILLWIWNLFLPVALLCLQDHKKQLPIPAKWNHSPAWFQDF